MSMMTLFWYVGKTAILLSRPQLSMLLSQYSRRVTKSVSLYCLHIIKIYNKFMAGTDQMDQNYNAYRIGIRCEKWWWLIFTLEVDLSMQNSWFVYRCVKKDISLLDFRRSVVQYYLRRYQNLPDHSQNRICTKESSIDCGLQTPSG